MQTEEFLLLQKEIRLLKGALVVVTVLMLSALFSNYYINKLTYNQMYKQSEDISYDIKRSLEVINQIDDDTNYIRSYIR